MFNFTTLLQRLLSEKKLDGKFLQYHHRGICKFPCKECIDKDKRIYKNGEHVKVPIHIRCDCYYDNVETKPIGTIASQGFNSPDVWLKSYGKLPDYYITKKQAEDEYGWKRGKNKLSHKAPGKMIGGDIYDNNPVILPEKKGRIWYECDIDYESGKRGSKRLYYSNDGLMFYSPDHLFGEVKVYLVE